MSVLRPAARVTGPDGREWEIYAYKIRVRDRGHWDAGLHDDLTGATSSPGAGELFVLDVVATLLSFVPRLLLRVWDVTVAAMRSLRSDEWTVEAITWLPARESFAWATTREHRGQVLAQVQGHMQRGDVPQRLRNATYLGCNRSAR